MCVYIKKAFERIFSSFTGSFWELGSAKRQEDTTTFPSALNASAGFGRFAGRKYLPCNLKYKLR